jgi:hypothetical protein
VRAFEKAAKAAGFKVVSLACTNPDCDEVTQMAFIDGPRFAFTPPGEGPCDKCGGTVRRFKKHPSEVESARIPWKWPVP